ncbi:MAG: hypothetical protein Kow00121_48790 [Elainellaceae cyanobacterium]
MVDPQDPAPNFEVDFSDANSIDKDPIFQQQVQRLYHFTVYSRWSVVALLWLCIAPICLWALRSELALWFDYFTWTAVRYTIIYNRLPAIGIILCLAATIAVLVWQSRNILWGLPKEEVNHLEQQVLRIRRQGRSHPLWKWVCQPSGSQQN